MGACEEQRWQARADVLYRKLADGGMLYDDTSGQVHHFNATAALIWEACQTGKQAPEIASSLRACYEVEPERAEADVRRVVQALRVARLLVA